MALRLQEYADVHPDKGWPRDGRRYVVLSNRAIVGTILHHAPPVGREYWTWHISTGGDHGPRGGSVGTKEDAMRGFRAAWDAWLAEAGLVEVTPGGATAQPEPTR